MTLCRECGLRGVQDFCPNCGKAEKRKKEVSLVMKHRKGEKPRTIIGIPLNSFNLYQKEEFETLLDTPHKRLKTYKESLFWQIMSSGKQYQIVSGVLSKTIPSLKMKNMTYLDLGMGEKLAELSSMMGSIGEDLMLAYAMEQDLQRLMLTSEERYIEQNTIMVRGLSSACALYILSACHTLTNFLLRLILLDKKSCTYYDNYYKENKDGSTKKNTKFKIDSNYLGHWLSMDKKEVRELEKYLLNGGKRYLTSTNEIYKVILNFSRSSNFIEFKKQRNIEFHRNRAQSNFNDNIRKGVSQNAKGRVIKEGNGIELELGTHLTQDPEINVMKDYSLVKNCLIDLTELLIELRPLIKKRTRYLDCGGF
jgi:hypothetical protein